MTLRCLEGEFLRGLNVLEILGVGEFAGQGLLLSDELISQFLYLVQLIPHIALGQNDVIDVRKEVGEVVVGKENLEEILIVTFVNGLNRGGKSVFIDVDLILGLVYLALGVRDVARKLREFQINRLYLEVDLRYFRVQITNLAAQRTALGLILTDLLLLLFNLVLKIGELRF